MLATQLTDGGLTPALHLEVIEAAGRMPELKSFVDKFKATQSSKGLFTRRSNGRRRR